MDDVRGEAELPKRRTKRIRDDVRRLAHRRRDLQSRRDRSRVVAGEHVVETFGVGVCSHRRTVARIAMTVGNRGRHGRRRSPAAGLDLVMNRCSRRVARRRTPLRAHHGGERRTRQDEQQRQACERAERTDHESSIAFELVQGCRCRVYRVRRRDGGFGRRSEAPPSGMPATGGAPFTLHSCRTGKSVARPLATAATRFVPTLAESSAA